MNKLLAQAITLPGSTTGGGTTQVPLYYPISQGGVSAYYYNFVNKFGSGTLGSVVVQALPYVYAFAGIGLLVMLVMGGFTYLTSAGDAKKMQQAQGQITNAVVGFVIVFVAYWFTQIAGVMLGITEIQQSFK